MEHVQFTKSELRIKSILGLPFWFLTFFIALGLSENGWWVYIIILIAGWYIYTLLYWKLYKKYMLNKIPKLKTQFYGLLVGYQLVVFAAIGAYLLIP